MPARCHGSPPDLEKSPCSVIGRVVLLSCRSGPVPGKKSSARPGCQGVSKEGESPLRHKGGTPILPHVPAHHQATGSPHRVRRVGTLFLTMGGGGIDPRSGSRDTGISPDPAPGNRPEGPKKGSPAGPGTWGIPVHVPASHGDNKSCSVDLIWDYSGRNNRKKSETLAKNLNFIP